jgi:hypothetical protein
LDHAGNRAINSDAKLIEVMHLGENPDPHDKSAGVVIAKLST